MIFSNYRNRRRRSGLLQLVKGESARNVGWRLGIDASASPKRIDLNSGNSLRAFQQNWTMRVSWFLRCGTRYDGTGDGEACKRS